MDEILNLIESVSEGFPSYSCRFIECIRFKNQAVLASMLKILVVQMIHAVFQYSRLCFVFVRVGSKTQKLIQLSPISHPRHLVGKRTAQQTAINDILSDSQVNSYFPHRWSPASLTINIYFYRFLYLYNKNNNK